MFLFSIYALRGAQNFGRFEPYLAGRRRSPLEPGAPLRDRDLDDVREMLAAVLRPFGHPQMTEPSGKADGVLHGRATNAGERTDLVDWQVARALALYFASDDAQHRPLTFGIMVPEIARQCARSA